MRAASEGTARDQPGNSGHAARAGLHLADLAWIRVSSVTPSPPPTGRGASCPASSLKRLPYGENPVAAGQFMRRGLKPRRGGPVMSFHIEHSTLDSGFPQRWPLRSQNQTKTGYVGEPGTE
jgi:hypothetical protein